MYSSKYSQVSKYSPEAQKRMQYRSRGKSCGYYMRIVFFFSSLIQSLIIISLVLFLIYGKKQDSASTSRIHDLEESFSRLSIENRELKQQRTNLTTLLNSTVTEKARNDWDLARLRDYTNISVVLFQDMERKMLRCNGELHLCKARAIFDGQCPTTIIPENCHCGLQMERLKAKLELVDSNFTQTVQRMKMDMDQITKERDNLNLEAIRLRRDKSTHEKEVEFLKKKCKDDFSQSLSGVSNVTTAFLGKIDSLFLSYSPFQLTCPKQREHLEQIRTNCSSLSREVEDRFQRYLNNVGDQVSNILSQNSRLKAENWRLAEDYRWCSQNRTGLIQQHKQSQDKLQLKHDQDKEKLLVDKMKLHGQIEVLENNVNYKTKEVEHLVEQIKHLNMTCGSRGGFGGGFGGALQPRTNGGSSLPSFGQFNKPGSDLSSSAGSFGSSYNKPNNAAGSSSSSLSSSGYGSNKPASSGYGSSSSSLSSSGYGSNKPASSGYGSSSSSLSSSGYGSNKPASSGYGSSSSSLSSSGSSNSGYGSNKPASSGYGSSSSSLSSSGSSNSGYGSNKPASSGYGSSSSSLSSSGSSNSGYGSNKPASSGYGSSSSSLSSPGSSSSLGSGSSKPASSGYGSLGSSSSSSSSSSSRGSSSLGSSSSSSAKSPSSSGSSSSGSSSSTGKSSSSSSGSWFNSWGSSSSSSSSGQSKTGTGSSKPASTGSGSSYGMGRTSGLTGGSAVSVAQHLRDLQRLINPAAPEEKQDLSRVLG